MILIDLSWCHKLLLLLMSLNAQIKGTFIKMECFITKPCPSHKRSKLQRFLSSIEEVIPKSSYRKELLLNLQRLHQGPMCVSEYFKELESQMFRVGMKERLNYSFGPSICHEISLWSSSFSLSQFGPHFLKTDSIWSSPLTLTKGC